MSFDLTPYLGLLFLSAVVTAGLGVYAWLHRSMPGAAPFSLLMFDATLWSLANALEMSSELLPEKLFWANLQYLCFATIPVLWLAVALHFTGHQRWLTAPRTAQLLALPALTNLLVWTNPAHGLIRRDVFLDMAGPFPVIGKTYGPWIYLHTAYSYFLMLAAFLLLLRALSVPSRVYRGQVVSLLVGLSLPLTWNILYVTGYSLDPRHDLTPAILSLAGGVAAVGLFRFRLFDILPVAHDAVLNSLEDGIIVVNALNRLAAINPAAQKILGRPAASMVGRPAEELFGSRPEIVQFIQKGQDRQIELSLPAPNGDRYYDLSLSPLIDPFGRDIGQLVILHDITDRKQVEEDLRSLSHIDPLTGLFNRRKFDEVLQQEITRARRYNQPLALIMIDVNEMKYINDHFGHSSGDEALLAVAKSIRPTRRFDTAARVGGDEFALILPGTPAEGACQAAWRMYSSLLEMRLNLDSSRSGAGILNQDPLPRESVSITMSLGVAELEPEDDDLGKALLARADAAMYRAKKGNLGCVVVKGQGFRANPKPLG